MYLVGVKGGVDEQENEHNFDNPHKLRFSQA